MAIAHHLSVKSLLTRDTRDRLVVRPSTATAYTAHVVNVLRPALGHHRLGTLTRAQVQAMFDDLAEHTNRYDAKITPSTVQRIRATLRRAMNAAVAHGYLTDNPARMLELPSSPRNRPVAWSQPRHLAAAGNPARVVMLTTFDLDEPVFAALRAGASGFLLKDIRPGDLAAAIRVVARGDALLAPTVTRRLLDRFAGELPGGASPPVLDALSDREIEVLTLVARALSNDEIAARLTLSRATVKTHLSAILFKLGLRDQVQAAVLAYECGLVRPGTAPPTG
jgi:DNA-binding NarL/FixJ family response regulator